LQRWQRALAWAAVLDEVQMLKTMHANTCEIRECCCNAMAGLSHLLHINRGRRKLFLSSFLGGSQMGVFVLVTMYHRQWGKDLETSTWEIDEHSVQRTTVNLHWLKYRRI
jgi:hypothetical protein